MGAIISSKDFSEDNVAGLLKPIIYCCSNDNMNARAVSINLLLAEKLIGCRPIRRTIKMESFFKEILEQLPDNVVIKDFDVMFNPEYKIDVLRIMTVACKKKPFSVIWCGKYEDGKLIYAEDGYSDFKSFNIDEYDVTCII